jgi:glycosyltransferase involved in cell wall biosynthesis
MGQALVEVTKRFPDALLLLAGGRLAVVEQIAAQAGLAKQVIRFGVVPEANLGSLLACADVCLLPYPSLGVDWAGFPNKLGDYMAAGRPVVSNPVGDSGQMIRSEGIGLLADETPEAFAQAICKLLSDPDQRTMMGQRARHLAETTYSWKARAEQVSVLYQDLINSQRTVYDRVVRIFVINLASPVSQEKLNDINAATCVVGNSHRRRPTRTGALGAQESVAPKFDRSDGDHFG